MTFIEGDPDQPIIIGRLYGTTNGGGNALFKGLVDGTYIFSVSADGHVTFGNRDSGNRPPLGASVIVAGYRRRASGTRDLPIHLAIELTPVPCRDCAP